MSKFDTLLGILSDRYLLETSMALLSWDQETYLPENGFAFRGKQVSLLSKLQHEHFTGKDSGEKITEIYKELEKNPDSFDKDQQVIIKRAYEDYQKLTKLPTEFVTERTRVISDAMAAWLKAREKKDFSIFASHLENIFSFAIKKSEYIDSSKHPYDIAVDEYEPGFNVEKLDKLFSGLKSELIPLLRKALEVQGKQEVNKRPGSFDIAKQKIFVNEIIKDLGFDFGSGRMDGSVHPFATTLGPEDIRITSRFSDTHVDGIYSGIHECGHALYEQGLSKKYYGTALGEPTSIGVHESQSRFWEVFVAREIPFMTRYFPRLQELFPHLKNSSKEEFYQAINYINASPMRIGADELSYHLHIILRYEMERDLFAGKITVKEAREVWNAKIKEYLGVDVNNDLEGILQDIHWAHSLLGYFPTYTIGSIYAAQFLTTMHRDIPEFDQKIITGNFHPIYNWLKTNIFGAGRSVTGPELIKNVTGEKVSEKYLLNHLGSKWSDDVEVNCAG